jgi:DNA-binding winged helix-turn-helix (wHTH) protein/tetratricopeptide (TPR) repeat protein
VSSDRVSESRMRSFDSFRLDVDNQCLWRGETRVSLMPKPFAVLRYLVEHPGRLVTQDQLLEAVWPDTYVQPEILRRYILEIRRALGDRVEAPRFVRTFPKRGYQFIAPVVDDDDRVVTAVSGVSSEATRLVGRESELRALNAFLSAALAGRRQMVFVIGEPGIGKTSLVDAIQRDSAATAGVTVARGQSMEGFAGKEAYYPILEAVGQLAHGPSRPLVLDTLVSVAPTWLIQFPSLIRPDQQAALQREILGATRDRMVRELCEALEVITQTVPLVLILEDLHWADHSTLDVISAVARRREPAKLLLVGTFRPAEVIVSGSPLKALKQDLVLHRLSHEVELERLREADVAAFVAAEFAPGDLSGLASVIYRHSDGNPLFMIAMLDHLAQQGVLSMAGGSWQMTIPVDRVDPGVPETLKQMLDMQLQHASDEERQLLRCASVAGQHFTARSVATMLATDPSPIEEMCATLVHRQQFLKVAGTRELPDGGSTVKYQFRHALYREVLYRGLNPTQRVAFHRRLAEGLEAIHSPAPSDMATEIALHFEEGHEYESAIRYSILAAQNATRRYAYDQSVTVLEHARELIPRLPHDRGQPLEFEILKKIGNAYYALGDMDRSGHIYASMATRAAEAGQLSAQADALMRTSHPAESIPFFLRAVEIDPTFAAAYIGLSRIYSNLGESARAKEYAKLAYAQLERASERDRLSIIYQYHYEVTGDQSRANQTLETWNQSFPLEFQPANSLAFSHNLLGNFPLAIEEGQEAVRRNPNHGYPYSNLAHAYRGIGRFDDAIQTAHRAVALEIETLPTRRLLYQLAVAAGDEQAALAHLDWARDRPREFDMVGARAQAAGWSGRVREARELYEQAARMAERRNFPDIGASHLAWSTVMELAYGNTDTAARVASRVLARHPTYDPRLRVALVLAMTGSKCEAQAIVNELSAMNPEHTFINSVLAPIVRAGNELGQKHPEAAIEQLRAVAPYELGFIAALAPLYLRGLAYLMLGSGSQAAAEFQRILDHRGSDPFSPFHAVAPLGLARALAMTGDAAGSLRAYERFLAAWAEADGDIPVLLQAREEHARLERRVSAAGRTRPAVR